MYSCYSPFISKLLEFFSAAWSAPDTPVMCCARSRNAPDTPDTCSARSLIYCHYYYYTVGDTTCINQNQFMNRRSGKS